MDTDRATDPLEATSSLSDDELVRRVHDFRRRSDDQWSSWREEAREDHEFAALRQWDSKDLSLLREQGRPPVTIDGIGSLVRAVAGSQVNNRQEVHYLSRGMEDERAAEVATLLAEWARQQCEAEDEESAAFTDAVISGMGWTELRVDYDDEPDGKIVIEYVDAFEMLPDPLARKSNLADTREVARRKPWRMADIRATWPGKKDELEAFTSAGPGGPGLPRWQARGRDAYRDGLDDDSRGADDNRVEVIEYQWAERVAGHLVADPNSGERVFMTASEFGKVKRVVKAAGGIEPDSVRHHRLEWRQAYVCGEVLLERRDSPCPFAPTFQCITGIRDRNRGTFYGIVRALKDPQRLTNKMLSQTLDMLARATKGGYTAEATAIEDMVQFENAAARSGAVKIVADGALSGGRFKQDIFPGLPAGHVNILQFAMGSFQSVSGISKELLGTADREQAGVLEAQRKQATQAILAPLFDSLRRYYKRQGRSLLHFIKQFVPPDKQIRVLGGNGKPEFLRSAMLDDATRYDLIVDEAPTSPNARTETWAALLPLFPTLAKLGAPVDVWLELFRYSPVPASTVDKIRETFAQIQQQQAQQPPSPDPALVKAQAQVQAQQAKTQSDIAADQARAQNDIQIAQVKAQADIELRRQKAADKARTDFAAMLQKSITGAIPIQ